MIVFYIIECSILTWIGYLLNTKTNLKLWETIITQVIFALVISIFYLILRALEVF